MANESGRLVKFVAKLNRMTQEGKIDWEIRNPPTFLTDRTDDEVHLFFATEVQDKYIGLYIRRYKSYDPDRDKYYRDEKTVLAFCADDWTPIWEFPPVAGINELLESIRRQSVKADSFIDKFLAEDDK